MATKPISLQELNAAGQDAFVEAIGFVFEGSPWIAAQAWHDRPFATLDHLHAALVAVMHAAPETQKLDLIRAHPDLAGKAAQLTVEARTAQAG